MSLKGGLGCLKGGLPPTPPLDDPLGLPGLRCALGGLSAAWAAGGTRRLRCLRGWMRRLPLTRTLSGKGARCDGPEGAAIAAGARSGWGLSAGAARTERPPPRVGGWATSRAARSSGLGCRRECPGKEGHDAPSKACRPAGAGPPDPYPQSGKALRARSGPPAHRPALRVWGRQPPHERTSEGGWVGHEPRSALVRDGGVGGAAPRRRRAGRPRRLVVRRAPDPLTPTLSHKGRGGRTECAHRPGGGVGAQPPQKEQSEGGWVGHEPRSALVRDGVWGAQPPAGDARGALEGLSSGGRRTPSPPPSAARGEGAGRRPRRLRACCRGCGPGGLVGGWSRAAVGFNRTLVLRCPWMVRVGPAVRGRASGPAPSFCAFLTPTSIYRSGPGSSVPRRG